MNKKVKERLLAEFNPDNIYNRPLLCESCKSSIMHYTGCGSYECPSCGFTALDDWGKVREYLYTHTNVNALDIANDLGIPRAEVNQMLKESKIQIARGADSFLTCEMCGRPIRYGRFCGNCEMEIHKNIEMHAKSNVQRHNYKGTLTAAQAAEDGQMYYKK